MNRTIPDASDLPSQSELNALACRKRHKIATSTDLVDLARSAQNASDFVNASASTKLREIVEQMVALKARAVTVLEQAKRDKELHAAACNLVKKPGSVYYFYEKENGAKVLSIISPKEWGANHPHKFIGAFQLLTDYTWAPVEKSEHEEEVERVVNRILSYDQPSLMNMLTDPVTDAHERRKTEKNNSFSDPFL